MRERCRTTHARRRLALAIPVALFGFVGCGDTTAPVVQRLLPGEFVLVWINQFPLPFEASACASFPQDCQSTIEDGVIIINEDGTFLMTLGWQHQWPAMSANGGGTVSGDVRFPDGAIEFTWRDPATDEVRLVMQGRFQRDGFSLLSLPVVDTCCDPFQWTPVGQIETASLRFARLP